MAQQYLDYVRLMRTLEVEVAAEYLVIAATLVFLKSKALLPPVPSEFAEEPGETPEEVEERLRRRLIAYSKYRDFGDELRERQAEAASFFYRETGDPVGDVIQRFDINPDKLTRAFLAMLTAARPQKRTIARERMSLLASMDYIMQRLKERGELLFSELCRELGMTRDAVILAFLAVLELIARRRLRFEQAEPLDDIRLFRRSAA